MTLPVVSNLVITPHSFNQKVNLLSIYVQDTEDQRDSPGVKCLCDISVSMCECVCEGVYSTVAGVISQDVLITGFFPQLQEVLGNLISPQEESPLTSILRSRSSFVNIFQATGKGFLFKY